MAAKIYDAEMHYLLIEQARTVGLDADGCVAPYDSDLESLEGHRLTPLLVYSIVVPAFRCQTRMLVDAAAPISVSLFLAQAWGLRRMLGMPQRLEMKPSLLAADRGFVQWAKSIGVQCESVQHTKAIAAYSTSTLDVAYVALAGRGTGESLPQSLLDANAALATFDTRAIERMAEGVRPGMKQADLTMFKHWLHRGQGYLHEQPSVDADWDAGAVVVPAAPTKRRAFAEPVWLDSEAPAVKAIMSMWPAGEKAFCEEVGVTPSEMRAWLSVQGSIGEDEYESICDMLHLGDDDESQPFLQPEGGCLLVADTEDNVACVYNTITDQGRVGFCFEAVSPTTDFDGYRVLLFLPEAGELTIILFKKGGKAESALSRNVLNNFQGPIAVPGDLALALAISTHDPARFHPGHVGCDLWEAFDEWFSTIEGVSDPEGDEEQDALHVASELIAQHWMATSNARPMIESAIAMGLQKDAIEEIAKIAFADGFRTGATWGRHT